MRYSRLMETPIRGQGAGRGRVAGLGGRGHLDGDQRQPGAVQQPAGRREAGFVRICSHYFAHDGFLEDGVLIRDAGNLAGIPGVLIHGRSDIGGPASPRGRSREAGPGPNS